MLWIKLRFLTIAILAVAIASGGASIYVLGSQEPAQEGQPVPKRPTTTPPLMPPPKPKTSTKATGQPATDVPRARQRAQQLATRKAKALHEIAKQTHELAEIAVEEYQEVSYPRDLTIVDGEIKLAESDLRRAEDRLEWARRMFDKGYVSQATKTSEELSHKKAMFSVEQAQTKKNVLVSFTKSKTIKELKSEVEKAHADELAKKAAWDLEKAKEIELERQLRPSQRS